MKKVFNALTSAVALIVICLAVGASAWPMSNHLVSYFWWSIGAFVGVWEIGLKVFTGKTLTTHVRDNEKLYPWSFWIMNIMWLYFAFTLFGHFIKRLVI